MASGGSSRRGLWVLVLAAAVALLLSTERVARAQDVTFEEIFSSAWLADSSVQRAAYDVPEDNAPPPMPPGAAGVPPGFPGYYSQPQLTAEQVEEIVQQYLEDHPWSGLPPGTRVGYVYGKGFAIRSEVPDPLCPNQPDKRLPFELRIRGRMQLDYYNYSVTNNKDYQTGQEVASFGGLERRASFSALEIKRLRLLFEGIAFNPNLKYRMQLNGDTRGLGGLFNNEVIASGSPKAGGGAAVGGGGVHIDHALRLYEAWVAYDFHGRRCPTPWGYRPTYTLIGGKIKPFCGLEEYLGSGSNEFVEFSMADWFFSPDDDNLLVAGGLLVKAREDRLYMMALLTNGSESNFSAGQLDDKPGFNAGMWYDFGGTWNEEQQAWQLFGNSLADIDTSPNPVVRLGAGITIDSMDRRRLYGDAEQSRFRGAVGGARLIDILNGVDGTGLHAVDAFDAYLFNAFAAGKYCGWSINTEFFVRYLNNFRTLPDGNNVILYSDYITGAPTTSLFPVDSLTDYGAIIEGGHFLVPGKLQVVGRYSMISGESGSINGNGTAQTVGGYRVVNDAFRVFHTASEYTLGLNWYLRGNLLKWQSDVSYYTGGNPASASSTGFITDADGVLVRTQLQFVF